MIDGAKLCSSCKQVKLFQDFYKASKEKTGYSHRCKACDLEHSRSRKNQKAEYAAKYVQSEQYKSRRAEQRRENTLVRMKHKIAAAAEIENGALKRWRLNAAQRYTRRLQATPKWLNEDQKTRAMQIYATTQQLQELTASVYHVDHIVPLQNPSVCGLHVWWNLQPLPEHDNIAKANMFDPTVFPEQGRTAFPDGAGPLLARIAMHLKKVEETDE